MTTRKVGAYLSTLEKTTNYQGLFHKINELNEIQKLFSTIIPAHLEKHCALGLPVNEKLIIFAKNASVATRLKQISPSLLQKIKNLGGEVTSIQIAVQAYHHTSKMDNFPGRKRQLSQTSKENLSEFASSLPESELKSAIESLLKNA
ncbi:MAG: DciA family protein [Nitrosomonas sp.]|nr:DciA family protein [Nitrosomonas sp.]MDP1949947.1 DciA family protein [Nitrosomonas sp.]